jgi:hypothetical protein
MPNPRVRFTIRRLMVVVAVVGLAASIPGAIERRREGLLDASAYHSAKSMEFGYSGDPRWGIRRRKPLDSDGEKEKAQADLRANRAAHHLMLSSKYRQAARRLWRSAETDSPDPW